MRAVAQNGAPLDRDVSLGEFCDKGLSVEAFGELKGVRIAFKRDFFDAAAGHCGRGNAFSVAENELFLSVALPLAVAALGSFSDGNAMSAFSAGRVAARSVKVRSNFFQDFIDV